MKKLALFIFIPLVISLTSCNQISPWLLLLFGNKAPVLNSLVITDTDSTTITLAQPTFSTVGKPDATVEAYIGLNDTITVSGSTVTGSIQGPVDVSTGGHQFTGLSTDTSYRIVVVAKNIVGHSVQQITQSTGSAAPVLMGLAISNTDESSIELAQPAFANTGNPAPSVEAYIGYNGTVSVSGPIVTGSIQGPVDVSAGGYTFIGLSAYTEYTIIVVAINSAGYSVQQIVQSTASIAPVLRNLSISNYDGDTITLAKPTFSTAGNPAPTVAAYIGLNGTISSSGSTVTGSIQGPVDVSTGGYQFNGLSNGTSYKIIVVAVNGAGYSVQQIVQSTANAAIAPVLNNLSISAFDVTSITIAQPTFSTAGSPTPSVQAYIGLNGTIAVSGLTVSNYLQGPFNVSTGGHQFSGLSAMTSYRVIVVAVNNAGYSVQQIVQSTAGIAPVLNSLAVSSFDAGSITIAQPTFSTSGNPAPTVKAYIGLNGTIAVSGSAVSGYLQGPIDVSTGGYQFSGLSAGTSYRVIVVAANSVGYSAQQIVQSTTGIAPVLNGLAVSAYDGESITIAQPTFSTAGNPAPTVRAYIGLDGTITASGSAVSGSLQGPIDVSTGGYQFKGLKFLTTYRIIVVAQNGYGYSTRQIVQDTAIAAGIYSIGFYTASGNTQACYWFNETKYDLPGSTPSFVFGIAFGENEIYLAGFYTLSGVTQACFWTVNTSGTTRVDLAGAQPSTATGIAKAGTTLYISGIDNYDLENLSANPLYWKVNLSTGTATRTALSSSLGAVTTGVAVAPTGDIDISGTNVTLSGLSIKAVPGYWKISGATTSWNTVQSSGTYAAPLAIYASGTTVYLGGVDEYSTTDVSAMRATYWTVTGTTKTKVNLANSGTGSSVQAIAFSGSTVYSAGQINTRTACYWLNSARTDLPGASGTTYSAANGIQVTGSGDLYLSGFYNGTSTTNIWGGTGGTACYWKATGGANPVRTDLPGAAPASAIRIVIK
jgi:hypothetical protein